jgi:hypothetical protein
VNFRLICCIGMGVFVAHLGLFMILYELEPKAKYIPPPKPNFSSRSETVIDAATGERLVYREITISTKLPPEIPAIPSETTAPPATATSGTAAQ